MDTTNPTFKIVRIFHYTAVLDEILFASNVNPDACILPRALVLEALDTIQSILFPADMECQKLLELLVEKAGFDNDLFRYKFACYDSNESTQLRDYPCFGTRLAMLHEELHDPSPRNGLELWLEKKSSSKNSPRNMLMATMIGVFIAVTLGILGLAVAIFQAWVGYQQWKHPVMNA